MEMHNQYQVQNQRKMAIANTNAQPQISNREKLERPYQQRPTVPVARNNRTNYNQAVQPTSSETKQQPPQYSVCRATGGNKDHTRYPKTQRSINHKQHNNTRHLQHQRQYRRQKKLNGTVGGYVNDDICDGEEDFSDDNSDSYYEDDDDDEEYSDYSDEYEDDRCENSKKNIKKMQYRDGSSKAQFDKTSSRSK